MDYEPDDHNEYDDEDCHECGGEGFVFSCFDGFCKDAEFGCDDCTQPCPECGIRRSPAPAGLGDVLADALAADGEKLRQLTGEDHGPWPLPDEKS